MKVLVEGLERARVQKYSDRSEYYEATAVALADTDANSVEAEALARSVVSDFESYVKLNKKISAEVVGVVQAITDFAKLERSRSPSISPSRSPIARASWRRCPSRSAWRRCWA